MSLSFVRRNLNRETVLVYIPYITNVSKGRNPRIRGTSIVHDGSVENDGEKDYAAPYVVGQQNTNPASGTPLRRMGRRRVKRKQETVLEVLCAWIVNHQIGRH